MKNQIKAEIIQINSNLYDLQERKKQLEAYIRGYEDAEKEISNTQNNIEEENGSDN